MLQKVHNAWIKGVLEQSLYSVARLELGLTLQAEGGDDVWQVLVQRPDRLPRQLPRDPSVTTIFDEVGAALLILGAPGCGKTTLLLELTQTLLERAAKDENHRLPVVFHLSSWAERQHPLSDWLVDELVERYQVPRKHAQVWIARELILPLLDGLDEVALDVRSSCAETINDFHKKHGFVPFVVCSRITDYQALTTKLDIVEALIVQPLTREQTNNYLIQAGEPLSGVRTALGNEESLWELLDTPLMLSVAALAYQGRSAVEIPTSGTFKERKTQLFAAYTDAMFRRRGKTLLYPRESTLKWLAWLASAMAHHSQSIFYLERIQPTWLPSKWQQRAVNIGALMMWMLVSTLIAFGLLMVVSLPEETEWESIIFGSAVIYGLYGFTGALISLGKSAFKKDIQPIETVRWEWSKIKERWISRLLIGGLSGGLLTLILATLIWATVGIGSLEGGKIRQFSEFIYVFVWVGLFGASIGGLVSSVSGAIVSSDIKTRTIPNEGIWRSLRNSFFLGLLSILVPTLFVIALILLFSEEPLLARDGEWLYELVLDLPYGLILGLFIGLFVMMRNGGIACCQHFTLRLLLWLRGLTPLGYIRFLDYAAERIFLRKVGGGYIFIHRMLLEYFAALHATKTKR